MLNASGGRSDLLRRLDPNSDHTTRREPRCSIRYLIAIHIPNNGLGTCLIVSHIIDLGIDLYSYHKSLEHNHILHPFSLRLFKLQSLIIISYV